MSYWCEFEGREAACVEGADQAAAQAEAERLTGCKVTRIDPLPYPARPQLNLPEDGCPPLCCSPKRCRGHSYCPYSWACSE